MILTSLSVSAFIISSCYINYSFHFVSFSLQGKFLQNVNFLFACLKEYFSTFLFSFQRKVVVFHSFFVHYTAITSRYFFILFTLQRTRLPTITLASAQSAIFLRLLLRRITLPLSLQYLPSDDSTLYSIVFLMTHIPPFLRIFLHHLPESGLCPLSIHFSF